MSGEENRNLGPGEEGVPNDGTPVVDLHEPIYREMAEPRDGFEPPPTWFVFFCLAVMGFAGWYLGMFSGGFQADIYDEKGWAGGSVPAVQEPVLMDPMVLGKRIYNNCTACHQQDGLGVAGNYPPLAGSPWVMERQTEMTAVVLRGLEGPFPVLGEAYNQVMPKWSHLTDEQLAAVLTFVRGSFGNEAGPVEPEFVASVREQTADRTRPWNLEDLDSFAASFVAPAKEVEPEVVSEETESTVAEAPEVER